MKLKNKLIILVLCMVLICCAGSVSATDSNNTVNMISDVDSNNEFISVRADENVDGVEESALSASSEKNNRLSLSQNSTNNDVINAVFNLNGGTFSDIQDLVDKAESGDIIRLSGKFKSDGKAIAIDKKLNIISSSGATLDGDGNSRIFIIGPKAKGTTIKNIKFKDGYTIHRGGAIYLNASGVVIDSCTFTSCSAGSGGAIATSTESSVDSCIIRNSRFEKNYALDVAGAITYIAKNLDMSYCVFDSNYIKLPAGEEGGSGGVLQIGVRYQDNNCKITHCNFTNNYITSTHSNNYHGGVACLRRDVTFSDCYFKNNRAQDGGVLTFHDGGEIIRCHFIGNTAYGYGGVIQTAQSSQPFTISHSTFSDNSAKYGGAIYLNKTNLNIYNSTFTKNNADYGGAIYSNTNLNIYDSCFTSNSAIYGGAIFNDGNLNSKNCYYDSNKAKSALFVDAPTFVNCSDDAVIGVTFEGGNNVINAIWSINAITLNDKIVNPNNYVPSQTISLSIDDKIYSAVTDDNGVAVFKFNTISFQVNDYNGAVSYENSKDYADSTQVFNLKITKKVEIKEKIKKPKKISKIKIFQSYLPKPSKVMVDYKTKYRYFDSNGDVKYFNTTGTKQIKQYKYKWINSNKKDIKSKYKWFQARSYLKTKYKATKITTKLVNGKIVKTKINKNHKYNKNSKYKYRTKDWSRYVMPSVDCESDNKEIIRMSKSIIENQARLYSKPVSKLSDSEKAHAILHWVQEYIVYENYGDTQRGALKTLQDRKGNCADQTHLAIALLRAANIPAKYEAKIVNYSGEIQGHGWHLAYINNQWVPGESTDFIGRPNYGESRGLEDIYLNLEPYLGRHKITYNFISKYVIFNDILCKVYEEHFINNAWVVHYGDHWDNDALTNIQFDIRSVI